MVKTGTAGKLATPGKITCRRGQGESNLAPPGDACAQGKVMVSFLWATIQVCSNGALQDQMLMLESLPRCLRCHVARLPALRDLFDPCSEDCDRLRHEPPNSSWRTEEFLLRATGLFSSLSAFCSMRSTFGEDLHVELTTTDGYLCTMAPAVAVSFF